MSGSYVLVIHAPGAAPQPREFSLARVVVGREVGDIVLPDPRCSSTHGELLFDGHTLRFRDLGSTNGTWANGQRVQELVWTPGLTLQIGGFGLTFQELRAVAPAKGGTVAGNVMMGPPPASPYAPTALAQPTGPAGGNYGPPQGGAYGPAPGGGYGPPMVAYAQAPGPAGGAYGPPPAAASPYGHAPPAQPHAPAKKKSSGALLIAIPVLLFGACVVGVGGYALMNAGASSDAPKMAQAQETSVKFVWFAGQPGPTAKGGTAPARIRVGPNSSGTVSVGVAEEFAGGGGNQWRTATWLAAFNATRTVGASLADYEFNVHVGGHVDGPSAGMLTTASMLALIKGQAPRADTTMTGTINPDGTAGPVGGIVQKMEGAKESGLKRFGFPIGCRNHKDMKTGETVDLMAVGQRLGLETKEIGDLYEGYEFLTGSALPRTEPLAEAEMEPDAQTQALLRAKITGWKARVDRELGTLKAEVKRTGGAVAFAADMVNEADKAYEIAQRYEKNGYLQAALENYAATAIQIALATRKTNLVFLFAKGNIAGLMEAVKTSENVKPEVDAYGQQLEVKAQGKTLGGQIAGVNGFGAYVIARAATMLGDDFLSMALTTLQNMQSGKERFTQENVGKLMDRLIPPTLFYDIARIYLDVAKDTQDLMIDEGQAKPIAPAGVDRTVAGYASASTAVLAYFDSLITDELAKAPGFSKDSAQSVIAMREPEYMLARKANALSEYSGKSGVTEGVKLMRLAAASTAYLTGAKLVNKWYSLDGHFDQQGNVHLENRRALTAQLDLARRNAREAAARAKATAGFVPSAARLAYQSGNAQREGSDDDKLNALTSFWQASFWSELAAVGK